MIVPPRPASPPFAPQQGNATLSRRVFRTPSWSTANLAADTGPASVVARPARVGLDHVLLDPDRVLALQELDREVLLGHEVDHVHAVGVRARAQP